MKGKTAIVTGASRGIGEAIAYKLASLGVNVAVIYAGNQAAAEQVVATCETKFGVKAKAYACDVADFNQVKTVVANIKADFEAIQILVNNAGFGDANAYLDASWERHKNMVDLNIVSLIDYLKKNWHVMGEQK